MWTLNRQTRYEMIKKLIINASPEMLEELVITLGFEYYQVNDDIEIRRKQLLDYLEEMNTCWKENYTDMTDRQFMRVTEDGQINFIKP